MQLDPGGALVIFYIDCLTNAQQNGGLHPSIKAFWMIVIILGKVLLEYFPSFRATATKGCCSLWQCVSERNGSGTSSQQKRHPAALCKSQRWCIARETTNQSHETCSRLPPFSRPDGRYETRRHEVCAWVLSQMTKPCWWITLIPSCLDPKSSWVHYSSLWLSKELDFPSDVWFCGKIWEGLKGINYSFRSLW